MSAKKPLGSEINGIKVPAGADAWRVFRFPDAAGKGQSVACAIPHEGRRIDWFPIEAMPPDWNFVLAKWGSGTYRLQWHKSDGKPGGMSTPTTFDDPSHPQLPAYQSPRPAPPAAPSAEAPSASSDQTIVNALLSSAKDGKIEVPMVMLLLQMVAAQGEASEARYRRWMHEDAERRRLLEDEHNRRLQQAQAWADQQAQSLATFWRAQTEAARALQTAPSDDRDDRISEALEAINERLENVGQAPPNDDAWAERLFEKFAPVLAQRFMQPPAPPAPTAPLPNGPGEVGRR